MTDTPLLTLRGVSREFPSGDAPVRVLDSIDLDIRAGEFVAIVGASGSGKSTLMNILGCLDHPTSGEYRVAGRPVADLGADDLAALRRERFGFIFQRYQLLPELTALGNVEIPAIYAGTAATVRDARARELLTRLGLADRLGHRPGQLSGGQQQRVSIARALMNGGEIILADEPTGALDSRSGEEVLRILTELNAEGRTVIVVTHDMHVAQRAQRIVEIADGRIVSDRASAAFPAATAKKQTVLGASAFVALASRFRESFWMAILAMTAHRMRTFLTMLGIVIGISAVVAVVALGEGARRKVISNIASLGTNTVEIFPGKGFGDPKAAKIKTLVISDAEILARQPYADGATPTVSASSTLRVGATSASAQVNGVGPSYFKVKASVLLEGRLFDENAARTMSQEAVIDETTRDTMFPDVPSPIGRMLLVDKVPCTVVGVVKKQQGFAASGVMTVFLPYSTVQARFLGDPSLRSILLRVSDDADMKAAQSAVESLLERRHAASDFYIFNTDDIRQSITATATVLTLLIAAIAVISLIVGGIGVMNIMLVSVSERVKEIGVRMAVGARRSDILRQFLIESVLVCLVGGTLGILTALAIGAAFTLSGASITFVFSTWSIVAAFLCSTMIGVVFGWLPAHSASLMDPVEALARD
ncbi:MacB family efflux pump subunit [Rhodoplanes sp. Z2-YC6860]|uniref:MacB family efflux pump subunit n=1 Tax=Rhodoplanes sp. Z2-YC6860 TaxID=674703 RepID=UPI00078B3E74|nr:MacB family efflux pump subunit [Rhodoplanes sp. Z2-YC6860]AMN44607.1 macrolide export ATP-binding/permease macB [Rhodoplanes sp. Z2-YC6860]